MSKWQKRAQSRTIPMINILLNGESRQLEHHCNIDALLNMLELDNKRLAVEINRQIIPRSLYSSTELNDGDVIEIVQAIGGGCGRG